MLMMTTGPARSTTNSLVMILQLLLLPLAIDGALVRMDRYSLSSYPRALCLDGSPAMYYHHPGSSTSSKWYIELQGGGWCGSVTTCVSRSQTQFGSSTSYNPTMLRNTPFFDDDVVVNPLMHDWNKVYFRYCDGFSFVGNASDSLYDATTNTTLYFRGYDILLAGMGDMLNYRDLSNATDVIVSGCSAGGLASLWTCDLWKFKIEQHSPNVTVKCAMDSGFFLNYNENGAGPTFDDLMEDGYELHKPILPTNCVANEPNATNCLSPEIVVQHVQSPVFVMQSIYDSWARGSIRLSDDNYTSVNAFGQIVVDTIEQSVMTTNTQNGIYVDSCKRHGCDGYDVMIDGVKKMEAIQEWYEGGAVLNVSYVQHEEYLCEACCTGMLPAATTTTTTTTALPSASVSAVPTAIVSEVPSKSAVPSPRPSASSTNSNSNSPTGGYCPCCCPSSHPSQQRSLLSSIMPSTVETPTTTSDTTLDTTSGGGGGGMGGTMILLIVFFVIVLCGIYMWVSS